MALVSCPECKEKVSDQASACPHCGHPMQPALKVDEPLQYETCRIEWGSTAGSISRAFAAGGDPLHGKNYFWADATRPVTGTYSAGCSPLFVPEFFHGLGQFFRGRIGWRDWDNRPPSNDTNTLQAHRALMDILLKDEWEPTNVRGSEWWQHSFRRPVRNEDKWIAFVLEPRWNGLWYREGPVSKDQEADFQQGITSGQVRREGSDYWMRRDWLLETIGSMEGELVSEIIVGYNGTMRITFRRPSSDKLKLEFEAELYESPNGEKYKHLCPAGTFLTILEESENWVRVRLPSGEEGFLILEDKEGEDEKSTVSSKGVDEPASDSTEGLG
jgi:hypothetical protein